MIAGLASAASTLGALLLLNGALTFENWWPTPLIRPTVAVSAEALLLVLAALAANRLGAVARRRVLSALAVVGVVLVLGHYAAVTLPALFGRPISLYWDGPHIPGLLAVALRQVPWWLSVGSAVLSLAAVWLLYRACRALLGHVAEGVASAAVPLRRAATVVVAGMAAAATLVLAMPPPPAGHEHEAPWRAYVADAVTAGWGRQLAFSWTAGSPQRLDAALPPSPSFDGDVEGLGGADVYLLFVESYGATAFDDPLTSRRLAGARDALAAAAAATGREIVSARVRSPTFGGGSWLAWGTLLAGIDLGDPARHALLMTSQRPTLVRHLARHGYRTTALVPGIRSEWPEGAFYGFDTILDAKELDYRGPAFGYWRIPDQFTLQRFVEQRRASGDPRPQFVTFATISSHIPFAPIPPYQPDWSRLTGSTPYPAGDVAASLAQAPDWLRLRPAYRDSLVYNYRWIEGFLREPASRGAVLILVGDHQPAASVSGRGADWDVPVHVITDRTDLLDRFGAFGFVSGLAAPKPALGSMDALTRVLVRAISTPTH